MSDPAPVVALRPAPAVSVEAAEGLVVVSVEDADERLVLSVAQARALADAAHAFGAEFPVRLRTAADQAVVGERVRFATGRRG